MSGNQTYDQIYKAELERLQTIEAQKDFLHNQDIGRHDGVPDPLRPPPELIDQSLGERKTPDQIEQEASQFAHDQMLEQQKVKIEDAQKFDLENRAQSNLDQLERRGQDNLNELANGRGGFGRDDDGLGR